jgi:predicted nucleotidyltransferase
VSEDLPAALGRVLAGLPDVDLAYLFGSHASGRARTESDIDVGVLVSADAWRKRAGTLAHLFDVLGRVVGSDRLDLVLLNDAVCSVRREFGRSEGNSGDVRRGRANV